MHCIDKQSWKDKRQTAGTMRVSSEWLSEEEEAEEWVCKLLLAFWLVFQINWINLSFLAGGMKETFCI